MVSSDVVVNYMKMEIVLLCMVEMVEKRRGLKSLHLEIDEISRRAPFPQALVQNQVENVRGPGDPFIYTHKSSDQKLKTCYNSTNADFDALDPKHLAMP